jgi:hypothetical protein
MSRCSSRLERLQYYTRKIRASHIVAVLPDPIELRGEALNVACENDKGDGKAVPGASSSVDLQLECCTQPWIHSGVFPLCK